MRDIRISDETMKRASRAKGMSLTFKEKLELAKLLDGLGVTAIEVEGIEKPKADALRIKSLAQLVRTCTLAVPVAIDGSDLDEVWAALSGAAHPRLQVCASTSPARMEYIHKMKADALADAVRATVAECAGKTSEVEFIAEDATRTDVDYLASVLAAAIDAGASIVTVCDDAGTMLPGEFAAFVRMLREKVPALDSVTLGISCSDALFMAESNAIAAAMEGAGELKATSYPLGETSVPEVTQIIVERGEAHGITCSVNTTALKRTTSQIGRICEQGVSAPSLFAPGAEDDALGGLALSARDDRDTVASCVAKLGYDLSDEDHALVYESFLHIASKKDTIGARELDAIVASVALQVPPTYTLERYTINSGSAIKATAYVKLSVGGDAVERVGMGDGPIDAALAAIDDIVGASYELDDWQMQSVTEGQEAMGEAVIKLMSDGKVYSGRGISTDIVGSSIRAYLNAINKAVYEEEMR